TTGTLNLTNSTVDGNQINNETGFGGGIYNAGTMTITSSTISNNSSPEGAGITWDTTHEGTIADSTLYGNDANNDDGGGLYVVPSARLALLNDTITGNSSGLHFFGTGLGGGIFVAAGGGSAPPLLYNTIVAGNYNYNGTAADDIAGTVVGGSWYNLIGTGGSGGLLNSELNMVGIINPGLGTFGDY